MCISELRQVPSSFNIFDEILSQIDRCQMLLVCLSIYVHIHPHTYARKNSSYLPSALEDLEHDVVEDVLHEVRHLAVQHMPLQETSDAALVLPVEILRAIVKDTTGGNEGG